MRLADLDFNGYQDLALVQLSAIHNARYDYYLFDRRTGRFEGWRSGELEFGADPERRLLIQNEQDSCCEGATSTYVWRGGDLVLVERESWKPNRRRGGTDYVRARLRRGHLAIVKRWHEPPSPGDR